MKTRSNLTSREKFFYFYLFGSIFGWAFCNGSADIIKTPLIAEIFARLAIIFPVHIANALLQIARIFPQSIKTNGKGVVFKIFNTLVGLFTILSIIFINTSLNISSFKVLPESPADFTPGILFGFVVFIGVVILIYIAYYWLNNFRYYTRTQKRQITYLLISLVIVYISMILGLVVLPLKGISQYSPVMFLSLSFLLFIINENLFIKGFVVNVMQSLSVINSLVFTAGLMTYFVLLLFKIRTRVDLIPLWLLCVLFLAICMWLTRFVSSISDKVYESLKKSNLDFVEKTTVVLDIDSVRNILKETLKNIFPDSEIDLVIKKDRKENKTTTTIERWWKSLDKPIITTKETVVERYIESKSKINKQLSKELLTLFEEKCIDIVIPLNLESDIKGIIRIKELKEVLGLQEYELLKLFSKNATVAISRATLYQKVKRFNSTLKQKVNEQTKDLKKKIEQLNRVRRKEHDMVDIMGHELRTPMTIIRNYHELLPKLLEKMNLDKSNKENVEKYNKYMETIEENIVREVKLINTLLSATKLDDEKLKLNLEPVNIIDVIEDGLEGQRKHAEEKNLELSFEKPDNASNYPKVFADRIRIQEVMDNLLSNAVKYTKKGSVTVKISNENDFVRIEVHDTGIGISEKDIKNLGKKFYRSNQYTTERKESASLVRPGGTGLGLFVTFGLVKAMGGKIDIESKLGEGSIFSFTVPLATTKQLQMKSNKGKFNGNMFKRLGLEIPLTK